MNAVTQNLGPCPCRFEVWSAGQPPTTCRIEGTKLKKNGHLVGCGCRSCIGTRNRAKGQATEAKRHRRLGGQGQTPRDELAYSYSVNVTTEDKTGAQIPASFTKFLGLDWTRHALRQAEKKLPVGSDALPALFLDCGRAGTWLVVEVPKKGLR